MEYGSTFASQGRHSMQTSVVEEHLPDQYPMPFSSQRQKQNWLQATVFWSQHLGLQAMQECDLLQVKCRILRPPFFFEWIVDNDNHRHIEHRYCRGKLHRISSCVLCMARRLRVSAICCVAASSSTSEHWQIVEFMNNFPQSFKRAMR